MKDIVFYYSVVFLFLNFSLRANCQEKLPGKQVDLHIEQFHYNLGNIGPVQINTKGNYYAAELKAHYAYGDTALQKFVMAQLQTVQIPAGSQTVVLEAEVHIDGTLHQYHTAYTSSVALAAELIRILNLSGPAWFAAHRGGRAINNWIMLVFRFSSRD